MNKLSAAATRWRLRLADEIQTPNAPKALAGYLLLPLALGTRHRALAALDRFLRFNSRSPLAHRVYRRAVASARGMAVSEEPTTLTRSIILKTPDERTRERGLLLTSFEWELGKIARAARLREITASYDIAFLPTWHPFYSLPLYQYAARAERPLLLMPSSRSDYELCRRRHADLAALPFQASSWVNADLYQPAPQKDIDIIMVANFSRYKRHWHLFRALRDLPRGLRVVIVGVPLEGRTSATLRAEASVFGTSDRFEIREAPPNDVLSNLLSRARVALALSAKEGSYIAVAEALFSGTPVGLYRDAVIGSKDYVNDRTGMLFDPDRPLARQIEQFLERAASYSAADWARANISSKLNCQRLNDLLRSMARHRGEPWSRDIAPFYCRHFDFHYAHAGDEGAFAPAYAQFCADYKLTIARPPAPDTVA
jgi:glycosyltransferase involved in cell wall biosynthesis